MSLQVDNQDLVFRNLKKAIADMRMMATKSTLMAAEHVVEVATPVTPIDTGNLRGSASVSAIREGNDTGAEIIYTAEYSAAVHENMEANFKKGGPKFLERTSRELQETTFKTVSDELSKVFK